MKRFLQSMTTRMTIITPNYPSIFNNITPLLTRCITPSSYKGKTARYRAKLKAKLKRLRRNKTKQ